MKLHIFVATGIVIGFFSATTLAATPQNVIIFGDSLSDAGMNIPNTDTNHDADNGNNTWVISHGKRGAPITNLDITSNTHPLWVNKFIDQLLPGERLYPYRIAINQKIDPYIYNVDFSYASAETNDHYLNDTNPYQYFPLYVDQDCSEPGQVNSTLACVPGVLKQIQLYLTAVNYHPNPKTLFILWAGGNDVFNNLAKLLTTSSNQLIATKNSAWPKQLQATLAFNSLKSATTSLSTLSYPIANLLAAKNKLINAGVDPKQIYVFNLPDISKTPAAIVLANGDDQVLMALHLISITYNANLLLALVYNLLDQHNLPADHVVSIDNLFEEMTTYPEQYQLSHLTDTCIGAGQEPVCQGFIFFNEKHPTTTVNEIISNYFLRNIHR